MTLGTFLPSWPVLGAHVLSFFFLDFVYLFILEREEGKEKKRNISVWLYLVRPLLGPATQACTLTGSRTGDSLVCRPALNLLSRPSQGGAHVLNGYTLGFFNKMSTLIIFQI